MGKPIGGTTKWTGTKGNDTAVVASLDALKRTVFDGGAGSDTLDLSALGSGISLDIVLGTGRTSNSFLWADNAFEGSWWDFNNRYLAGSNRLDGTAVNFEKIIGTSFNDYLQLRGGTVARVIDGGAGDDAIYLAGSTGTNTAIGGAGSDQLFGSYPTDLLIGGTYVNGVAPGDDTRDEFEAYAGTILDFEVGIDTLYIDAASLPGQTTSAVWQDVTTSYGAGASLTLAPDRVITVIGVSAATMNETPNGYVLLPRNGQLISGAGDDFIFDTASATSVDRLEFPSGSGDDQLVGFDVEYDTLVFAGSPTFSEVDYHGATALLATYDGGLSSVLLIGLDGNDVANLQVEII